MKSANFVILALALISMPVLAEPQGKTLEQELKSNSNRFARVDANGDSFIDAAELLIENTRIAERDKKPVSSGKGGVYGRNADTDNDGKVSLAESESIVRKQFSMRDVNGDGIVTVDEKEAAKK
jgi:hypothetical protein